MRQPFNILALLYACGVIAAEFVRFPVWIFLSCSVLLLAFAIRLPKIRIPALIAVLFLTGWTNATVQSSVISPHDLRQRFDGTPQIVAVRGNLLESPRT